MSKKTKIVYSDKYYVDIGAHVFPTVKYRLIKEKLLKDLDIVNKIDFIQPEAASEKDLERVHTKNYLDKLKNATLSAEEILTLELPYSKKLDESARLFAGGTIRATVAALEEGLGVHLGGGFHHAFPDHGEGFCVLNDIAVAVRTATEEGRIKKALIIDCDLQQVNWNAYRYKNNKNVSTSPILQENNYPFYKPKGDMDIGLADRTKDRPYLLELEKNIPKIISDFKPELIMYVAGADPYRHDQVGNLALTMDGLKRRDLFIYDQAKNYQIPLAIVLAGGYAVKQEDTVEIQFNTIKEAVKVFN